MNLFSFAIINKSRKANEENIWIGDKKPIDNSKQTQKSIDVLNKETNTTSDEVIQMNDSKFQKLLLKSDFGYFIKDSSRLILDALEEESIWRKGKMVLNIRHKRNI